MGVALTPSLRLLPKPPPMMTARHEGGKDAAKAKGISSGINILDYKDSSTYTKLN
jgi:hypothetical protein